MGKIMDKLKHNYHAFPELQTMFFHKHCVIWSFAPSFKEFHQFLHFQNFRYNNNEEKSYNKWYLPLSFSNYNCNKSKVTLFTRDQWYRCFGKDEVWRPSGIVVSARGPGLSLSNRILLLCLHSSRGGSRQISDRCINRKFN